MERKKKKGKKFNYSHIESLLLTLGRRKKKKKKKKKQKTTKITQTKTTKKKKTTYLSLCFLSEVAGCLVHSILDGCGQVVCSGCVC